MDGSSIIKFGGNIRTFDQHTYFCTSQNNALCSFISETVDDFNKVIDLFNEVYFLPMKSIYDSVIFFDTNNINEFTDLKGIVRLDDLLKFLNFDKILTFI